MPRTQKKKSKKRAVTESLPPAHSWRSTDEEEIARRRFRGHGEQFRITNLVPARPVFSQFRVHSASGRTYHVEIRDVKDRQFACECVDFRTNGLGTCKHVEAVLWHVEGRLKRRFREEVAQGPTELTIALNPSRDTLCLEGPRRRLPRWMNAWVTDGTLREAAGPEEFLRKVRETKGGHVRISQEVEPWMERRRRVAESRRLRHEYERRVQAGEWPVQETLAPLFPYQREGMLHLAFTERALLADEMGLGKTIQAIAACALLHRLGQAHRVLIVAPASLKSEWEEQIQRFTRLPLQLVFGGRIARLGYYTKEAPFFTVTNYEQMVKDALDVNERLQPDVVVLDEAQRIKNWGTKTAQAIKRLRSRYAFVLTGTPIENRIDELHSLLDFLDPAILGPLFRFNREFYILDERGKPAGCRQLDVLHQRVRPVLLRRLKAQVETELPDRSDRTHFVTLSPLQRSAYDDHEEQVTRLAAIAKRRPLTVQEQEKLMRELAMMRMICDTNYILNPEDRTCPKLAELQSILEECREQPEVKVIVFSEWERMLELVRDLCDRLRIGYAWHTGSVPQARRRAEINTFKQDPDCRVFLSTDAGATGLNLQNASVVINCDLPWNPAKLEQRIARAWRKNQTRSVQVFNLVSEDTIEHRMLGTLADKQALAGGVLDRVGDLTEIKLRSGREAILQRLEQILAAPSVQPAPIVNLPPLPTDRAAGFAEAAAQMLGATLLTCDETYPRDGAHSVLRVVVERDAATSEPQLKNLRDRFFAGTDPLAPVQLQVIDRATEDALQRLAASGVIAFTTRASRPLYPPPQQGAPTLTPEQETSLLQHRNQLARQIKVARALGAAGLEEESRISLLEAIRLKGCVEAIQHHLPEPDTAVTALQPPLGAYFGPAFTVLSNFVSVDAGGKWEEAAAALG